MDWIIIAAIAVLACFAFVIIFGAPYLPTMQNQQTIALNMLDMPKGGVVLDIGSGDGRFLRAAAMRGYTAHGIEANPILVLLSKVVTHKYRHLVHIKWANMWSTKWPQADGVYVFLHTRFMEKLDKKIEQEYHGKKVNVVSYAFKIPGKKVVKKSSGLFLYRY
jgi:hypothetical protein